MKDMSSKKVIYGCIVILVSLFSLIAFKYPYFIFESYAGTVVADGFEVICLGSAFSSLPFHAVTYVSVAFSILQLFVSITSLLFGILGLFFLSSKTYKIVQITILISCFLSNALYMMSGFVFVVEYNASSNNFSTLSYLGLIICSLFVIGYIACRYYLGDETDDNN